MPEDDSKLLRRYAAEKSEAAFAELVQRHLDLVYSVALRQANGDAALAHDVAQTVFTALARKAAALASLPVLGGWLYRTTQFTAIDAVRAESRRRAREMEAHTMQSLNVDEQGTADWEKLRPTLDRVIGELRAADRDAIVLRFFEGKSFADVGARLQLTENAARMRVERAVDKIHTRLVRQGVTSTSAALGLALAHQTGTAAPAGLAASVTGAALAGAGVTGATTILGFMSITKIGVAAAVILAGAAALWWQHQANERLQNEVAALRDQNRTLTATNPELKPPAPPPPVPAPAGASAPSPTIAPATPPPAAADPASAGMIRVEQFVNAGRASPRATLETSYWARKHIDLTTLANAVAFDEAGKERATSLFALLSDDLRQQYGTPEHFAAMMLADLPCPNGIEVLDEIPHGPDDVELKVRMENADGKVSRRSITYHRYEDGWKNVIPAPLVDAAVNSITRNPGASIPRVKSAEGAK